MKTQEHLADRQALERLLAPLMGSLGDESFGHLLNQLVKVIDEPGREKLKAIFRRGEDGYEAARALVQSRPDVPANWLLLAAKAADVGRTKESEDALLRAKSLQTLRDSSELNVENVLCEFCQVEPAFNTGIGSIGTKCILALVRVTLAAPRERLALVWKLPDNQHANVTITRLSQIDAYAADISQGSDRVLFVAPFFKLPDIEPGVRLALRVIANRLERGETNLSGAIEALFDANALVADARQRAREFLSAVRSESV